MSVDDDRPAVVLLSGGLDSATVLGMVRQLGGERPRTCCCLTIDYGQRHFFEVDAARAVAAALRVAEHKVVKVDLRAIGGSALTDDIDVPKHHSQPPSTSSSTAMPETAIPGTAIPATYVPARNLVFLSIAAGYAEVVGARDLYVGVNAVDYSGYPDCREPFIRAFEHTANLATKVGVEALERGLPPPLRVHAPLIAMTKADIIRTGIRCRVRYELTRSCYDPDAEGRACAACDACRIRRQGFADAGVSDPTIYAPATDPRP